MKVLGDPRGIAVKLSGIAHEDGANLAGREFADEVRGDEARAVALGATGVPFFVIDETYGVAGAQPSDVLLGALERAWSESHPIVMIDEAGAASCADDSCSI